MRLAQIAAGNLIVRHLARVIVESNTVKMVRKAVKYRIRARSVQVNSFLFFCFKLPVESRVTSTKLGVQCFLHINKKRWLQLNYEKK